MSKPPVFKPRARLMLLLGDQLIRDTGIAVFELVKNAYDADASRCRVRMENVEHSDDTARIVVTDNGSGMDLNTVLNVWLEPGTEFRKEQRRRGVRTAKYGRMPLGEKGVGRFAVHKLGREVTLITRKAGSKEVVVTIDWSAFEDAKYLDEVPVEVAERDPVRFKGRRTGTRIEIASLRELPWTRRRVRALQRAITSICSPFEGPRDFSAELLLAPDSGWLGGLLRPEDILKEALFRFEGEIEDKTLVYSYTFMPRGKLEGLAGRSVRNQSIAIRATDYDPDTRKKQSRDVDLSQHRIGPVCLDLRIFDREPAVLKMTTTDIAGLKDCLDTNGGIRVYRDGVRVYDFGEPGNDWLELGGRRVNVPARRISNNQVIGEVLLDLKCSEDLIEKTNREGFVENDAYRDFRDAIGFAVLQAEAERNRDKKRIRALYSRGLKKEPVLEDLNELRQQVERHKLTKTLGPYLDKIESQYRDVQDRLLVAAGAGLNLASVMHEVEKGVELLFDAIKRNDPRAELVRLARRLSDMVDGLAWLTKKGGTAKVAASVMVKQAIFNSEYRFRGHHIKVTNGIEDCGDPEFEVRCSRRLVMAALMNLVDNSIYWLDTKGAKDKLLYVGTTFENNGLPAIVVADSGPGLMDPGEYLVQPFFTRKPDGIGLGLHIADEVMKSQGGRLLFPERDDITLPQGYDGAIILLEFGVTK